MSGFWEDSLDYLSKLLAWNLRDHRGLDILLFLIGSTFGAAWAGHPIGAVVFGSLGLVSAFLVPVFRRKSPRAVARDWPNIAIAIIVGAVLFATWLRAHWWTAVLMLAVVVLIDLRPREQHGGSEAASSGGEMPAGSQ